VFPILHQYEVSPFSEKVRRILAYKSIAFHSVRAPAVMPKPDLVALTGGYRRIPVLQMGNHVYCDTALIARVLERIQPTPTLYPTPLADIVASWADQTLFAAVVPLGLRPTRFDDVLQLLTQDELGRIGEDRASMHADAQRGFLSETAARAHVPAYLQQVEAQLATGAYLFGEAPCIADFAVYHCTWFLQMLAPEPLAPFAKLKEWMERIRTIPDAPADPLPSEEALEVCRRAGHREGPVSGQMDASGLGRSASSAPAAQNEAKRGTRVVIRATDYGRDPVEGDLVVATDLEFAIRREDPRAGSVIVHFPRLGYEVRTL
jgi:glutathione S-transferase